MIDEIAEAFIRFVVQGLQRRGLFRNEFAGTTLRENFGLPVPSLRAHDARRARR